MQRYDIINTLIHKYNYKSYLEIGCQGDVCFNKIICETKVGVDPEKGGTLCLTSDDYFNTYVQKFDIIFIDGLHEAKQVSKDILNSLDRLNEGGVILCHDMNPQSEIAQRVPREVKVWNGDCWKAFVYLRQMRSDLDMLVIDTDHGVGVIKKKFNNPLINTATIQEWTTQITYEEFDKNRKELLNLISVEEFKKIL